MTFDDFMAIAKRARAERTVEAATALVHAYVAMDCAAYPVDHVLFVEVFGAEAPTGFTFVPYRAMGANSCLVRRK